MDRGALVIGAGYAGLVAADILAGEGVEVTVLEARDRVGGRAWSTRTPEGAVVDLGAQWIGPPHEHLLALANRLGITTVPAPDGATTLVDEHRELPIGASLLARAPRTAIALAGAINRLERIVARVPAATPWSASDAPTLDATSVRSWLEDTTRDGLARRVLDALLAGGLSADLDSASLLGAAASVAGSGGVASLLGGEAEQQMFAEGSDAIAHGLASRLGDAVRLEVEVTELVAAPDSVVARGPWGEVAAEHAILAMPPTFAARLLGDAAAWRSRMSRGAALKAIATYPTPFWRDAGRSGSTLRPSGPVTTTFDVSRGGFGMLATLVVGSAAIALYARAADERRALVLDAFHTAAGAAALEPLSYREHSWAADPMTLGGYGELMPPGVLTEARSLGSEPIGRVHFAGTETSPEWNGYLEGAVRSGERAAREVLASR